MLLLNLDRFACDAGCLRCVGGSAKASLGGHLHAYLVLSRRVLDHLRVDRERIKRRQDCQHGGFGSDPLSQGNAVLDSFSAQFRTVRWYQDVGIHRPLLEHRRSRVPFEAELLKQIGPAKRELVEALLAKERAKLAATNPRQSPGRKMLFLEGITRWNRIIEIVTRLARLAK